MPQSKFDQLLDKCMDNPNCTVGYFMARDKKFSAKQLKALFKHAARRIPDDLKNLRDEDTYELGQLKKANLVYHAARNAGNGPIKSAQYWLKTII